MYSLYPFLFVLIFHFTLTRIHMTMKMWGQSNASSFRTFVCRRSSSVLQCRQSQSHKDFLGLSYYVTFCFVTWHFGIWTNRLRHLLRPLSYVVLLNLLQAQIVSDVIITLHWARSWYHRNPEVTPVTFESSDLWCNIKWKQGYVEK